MVMNHDGEREYSEGIGTCVALRLSGFCVSLGENRNEEDDEEEDDVEEEIAIAAL